MNLHRLVLAPPPPPMPAFAPGIPRRPGERREPLPQLTPRSEFVDAAAERGLAIGCAIELALERALVVSDYRTLEWSEGVGLLLEAAARQRFTVPLPAPYRSYRDRLLERSPRALADSELDEPVAVPLRFFPRALGVDYEKALTEASLDEAITLELAALCDGRTMSEYSLVFAARSR